MRHTSLATLVLFLLVGCGGGPTPQSPADEEDPSLQSSADQAASEGSSPASVDESESSAGGDEPSGSGATAGGENEFQLGRSDTAGSAHGVTESKIKPTKTEAAMKFVVVDKNKNEPIEGIVISLASPDGKKYFTGETDAKGYAEVLVPVGKDYELVYLSLGQRDVSAKVSVPDEANQNIKLTLRYKPRTGAGTSSSSGGFILMGVTFDSGKAKIRPESLPRLESVVEFMTHKKSARVEISGHTDNVGKAAANKKLSQQRAESVRKHLISRGIDGSRIEAVGYGSEKPVAPNTTEEGRQKNRRIEAKEL